MKLYDKIKDKVSDYVPKAKQLTKDIADTLIKDAKVPEIRDWFRKEKAEHQDKTGIKKTASYIEDFVSDAGTTTYDTLKSTYTHTKSAITPISEKYREVDGLDVLIGESYRIFPLNKKRVDKTKNLIETIRDFDASPVVKDILTYITAVRALPDMERLKSRLLRVELLYYPNETVECLKAIKQNEGEPNGSS